MTPTNKQQSVFQRRAAGVVLHPTSLPSEGRNGDLGQHAYHFVDFLHNCGFSIWQLLPLVPTHEDGSPYMGLSVFAGNPKLISIARLIEWGWLNNAEVEAHAPWSTDTLVKAYQGFQRLGNRGAYELFLTQHEYWLDNFALFMAIRQSQHGKSWAEWPQPLRDRDTSALEDARFNLREMIELKKFEQFIFFQQWLAVKHYANEKGVKILGDMPIFVAHDSAEVWAYRQYFDLDEKGVSLNVAGVPPDYFSATGQRWGNPLYKWKTMQADGFLWWEQRIRTLFELHDYVRIDHFRGFEAYWEVPASEPTAMNGTWKKAPGKSLFNSLVKKFGQLPFVAEDLGTITPEVDALREKFHWPGMKILQFAFDGNANNPYLPHNHQIDSVVYTGTHDNDTSLAWFNSLEPHVKQYVYQYLGNTSEVMPWALIRCALRSVAALTLLPMQDILALGEGQRMNTPGTNGGNWQWRFNWAQVRPELAGQIRQLLSMYGRL